ncbi:glycosyl hydrolase family 18 protein [Butyrivibrio sp. YAB3001]|uniref:glycosyl hydrolase family 18 protein n=1 Tax=Butyrivibrio sp. YAB3001 TaxID=1520812 RepID=UPI0008F65664|nr:glycosyl hydrolase family 18 protein [Butyrivibrio sp. YAB3001]SFC95238.1 Spore germination protein YaaH [Butyrivibrio sp. YAB3001]
MKKKVIPAIIIIALIFVIGGVYAAQIFMKKYSYSTEKADLNDYFDIQDDTDVAIILGNERIEERARLFDDHYYMDFASVQKYLNRRFFYGKADNLIFYTTATKVIHSEIGTSIWEDSDGNNEDVGYAISKMENDTLYLALDFVKKFTNFEYEGFTGPNHMQLTTKWDDVTVATVSKDTQLRLRGGIKSEVLEELSKGDKVIVLEELENWSKVKSGDSFIGYVENKKLSDTTTESPIPVEDYVEEEYTSLNRNKKINLGFHNIGGPAGNDTLVSTVSGAKSLNVVCPTWYKIGSEDGTIESIASTAYTKKAHELGLEVWALVDNFTSSQEVSTSEFLSRFSSRQNAINNLMSLAAENGVDGINLDFETISTEDGQAYIEFVRELSVACRKNGLVFSIDDYVPMNFNDHYDIKEQGIVADYVIIMGYDEHYAGSAEAGSVASLSYVENGLKNTVAKVDPSKVINAVPFYTRIWHTTNGALSSEAVSMKVAQEYIANHNIELTWNPDEGQNYGEFRSSNGTLNQIWVEDATSIKQKIDSMRAQNIAGIAEWSLGMETSDIWDVIASYIEE